jgi:hypothetical protein
MKDKSGLLTWSGLDTDSGHEIVNGALAQDAGQASLALDDGIMDLD